MSNILNKITHMIRPGKTSTVTNEVGNIQTVQAQHNQFETSNVHSMQLVGFASSMPIGSDVMRLNVAGDNSNGVIIASNNQTARPKNLAAGETMLYDCAASQQSVYLKANGTIVVTSTNTVIVTAPSVEIHGNLHVFGSLAVDGDTISASSISLEHHVHSNVQSGSSNSGPPV